MLAHPADPFDSPDHLYEIKWDGTRCILFLFSDRVRLQNRRGVDITHRYPELQNLPEYPAETNVVLDGELVVLQGGISDFRKLQRREHLQDPFKIRLMSRRMPATYVAFDILYRGGARCTREPLQSRKEMLAEWIGEDVPGLLNSEYVHRKGVRFFRNAVSQGLEGVMAKSLTSPYRMGKRSRDWLKIKARHSAVCFIVGFTPGKGNRQETFGALALAEKADGSWNYRGRVGSGFSDTELAEIHRVLTRIRAERPPSSSLGRHSEIRWVDPKLRCRVLFQEYTRQGHFRAPVFDGLVQS